jgi:hypothetical protein
MFNFVTVHLSVLYQDMTFGDGAEAASGYCSGSAILVRFFKLLKFEKLVIKNVFCARIGI